MPGRVRKVPRQVILFQYVTSSLIDLANAHTSPYRFYGDGLRLPHRLIRLAGLAWRTANVHRASPVRTVARKYNTEVADHESPGRNHSPRSAPMRQRRPLPRRD